MGRKRNDALVEATSQAIKDTARQLMAEEGATGLSIRGIAKVLEITPPAIYHYFPSLEALITTLITENFNALADALEAAQAESSAATATGQLFDVLLAYRRWAVEHPTDFNLIYGTPIPGYVAPGEVTVPAVVRTFITPVALMEQALQTGEIIPTAVYATIPAAVEARLNHLIGQGGYPISVMSMYLTMTLWTQIHGIIYLELYHHLGPNVDDVAAFYQQQLRASFSSLGLKSGLI